MKKRSPLAGVVRRCSAVVDDEQCQGTLTGSEASMSLGEFGVLLCRAHQHARHVPAIEARDREMYAEFKARADAIRVKEAAGKLESRVDLRLTGTRQEKEGPALSLVAP